MGGGIREQSVGTPIITSRHSVCTLRSGRHQQRGEGTTQSIGSYLLDMANVDLLEKLNWSPERYVDERL